MEKNNIKKVVGLDSAQGLMALNESANGVASSTRSAQGTFNQTNQMNMINTTTGNEQVSAGGLFTSSQSTNTNSTNKK